MGKDKKRHDEKLQELREKNYNRVGYLKRQQEDEDATKRLREYLRSAMWKNREDEDR